MTTIAYRAGVLAGDGRETYIEEGESSMVARDDCVKIHRLPDGRLFGGSKTSEDINVLHDALVDGCKQEPPKLWPTPKLDDINAMVIDTDGTIYSYEGVRWEKVEGDYFAVGSGARFAFPALDADATAERAVQIGVKRDPFSGGKISVLRLLPEPSRRPQPPEPRPSSKQR
jgi:hypothetical protein